MPKKIDLSGSRNPNLTIANLSLQGMVDRYKNERYVRFVPGHIPSDSRAVWLSKNAIDKLLQDNPGCTGLRFYFGVNDDINHAGGAHNIIIVTTDTSGNFNIDRCGDNDTVIVTETFDLGLEVVGESESALCPPPNKPCEGNTLTY